MELLFWLSFAFVFYVYFGYPALLVAWRRLGAKPVRKQYWEPTVSIVIAAYNERLWLDRKLQNCLALDYPKCKLQIIVSLDGATDGSEFVVRKYVRRGVELVQSAKRFGKAVALNRAMLRANGEIVVFADARQKFNAEAVRELVANFADQNVGAVSGQLVLLPRHCSNETVAGLDQESRNDVGLYWRYEKAMRLLESRIHSVAGATGAIYAIRRNLYENLPADAILDDVLTPLRIVLKGKRSVFEPGAKAYDAVACCARAEYVRKVRTLYGNYQLLAQLPESLVPWRNPIFVQFMSHKVGRLLVPWALLTMCISNLFLLRGFYIAVLLLQVAWYGAAAVGFVVAQREDGAPVLRAKESERAA